MPVSSVPSVEELARSYDDAWNAHDVDAILALHADDMVFHVHLPGYEEITGTTALREHFEGFFALWPDLEFRPYRLTASSELFTNELTMAGTLAAPMTVGGVTLGPTAHAVEFEAADIVRVDNGRIKRKDTYIDSASLLAQVGALAG